MATSTDDVVVRLRLADVQKFIRDVKAGKLAIDDLESKVRKVGETGRRESSEYGGLNLWGATVGRIKYAVAGLALAAGSGAVAMGTWAIKATANLEQIQMGFKSLLGSQAAADKMISDLQEFNKKSPFQLTDIESFTQSLLASGLAAENVIPVMRSIGDTVAAFGGGKDQMEGIITAMEQMAISGRLYTQDINQLIQRKVNVYPWLAQALGVTEPQVKKMVTEGKLASSTAIPIILKAMESHYKGAAEAQSHTMAGIWSNIIDDATKAATDRIYPFRGMIEKWMLDFEAHIPQIANTIADILGSAFSLAQKAGSFVASVGAKVSSGDSQGAGKQVGAAMPGLMEQLLGPGAGEDLWSRGAEIGKKSISFVLGFIEGIMDLGAWWGVIKKHWGDMILLALNFIPGFGKGISAFAKFLEHVPILRLLAPFFARWGKMSEGLSKPVSKFAKAVWHSIERVFPEAAEKMGAFFGRIGSFFKNAPGRAKEWALGIGRGILDAVVKGVGWAIVKLWSILKWIFNPWHMLFESQIVLPIIGAFDKVKEIGGKIKDFLLDIAKSIVNKIIDMVNFALGGISIPGMGRVFPEVPHLAHGGTATAGGTALVGDRGPELIHMPRGASVVPLPASTRNLGDFGRPIYVSIQVDRREIARAAYGGADDLAARL